MKETKTLAFRFPQEMVDQMTIILDNTDLRSYNEIARVAIQLLINNKDNILK